MGRYKNKHILFRVKHGVIMKLLKTAIILIFVGLFFGVGVIYSGYINVGANVADNRLIDWLLVTAREKSVERHSKNITNNVPNLEDQAFILAGAKNYDAMCASCHTPPGESNSPLSIGMNPPPPDLQIEGQVTSANELFWVTKNGIRMTGMPAWGATHDDDVIWSLVAFIKTLPKMTSDEYTKMIALAKSKNSATPEKAEEGHSGHSH